MADETSDPASTTDVVNGEGDRLAMPVDLEQPPRLAFPVVAIGASAGGLEAFIELFKAVPDDCGLAFVLIQHLPPDRENMMTEILQRQTLMAVSQVEDGMAIEVNHVYVIRPGRTLTLHDGHLHLTEPIDKPRHTRPVDDFFKSLAEEQRERAICVVLSGMGSNGAAGAQAVKAVGGLCIAQDPESAEYPSMPRHLIDAGYADLVLKPSEIPEALLAYAKHPYAASRGRSVEREGSERARHAGTNKERERQEQHVREILAVVRSRTRFDFNGYKKPTVLRRIERRMGLSRVGGLAEYAKFLRQSPTEVAGLADDLLIHVTGFFRDPEAWETLRQRVIIPLVQSREADGTIRCWVAACSSGEEAYSLAMLLVEECERADKPLKIKIFATDTAERTLSNARNGVYPGGIESDMPPQRLQRFFDREDAIYRVRQDLRERVVFAPQNVLSDPPFSRLDIVSCRNLLIYLEPEVQQRVFSLVHFGLREGGALFLGSSETVPAGAGTFEPIDKKARIFRRVGSARQGTVEFPLPRVVGLHAEEFFRPAPVAASAAPSVAQLTARALVALHIHAAVTVDRSYRIIYYQGETKDYLAQPTGEPTQDLLTLAAEHVRGAVRMVLQRSMANNSVERATDGVMTNAAGKRCRIEVTASPLSSAEAASALFVVSFQQREEAEPGRNAESADERLGQHFTAENQRLREELQGTIEELQASNEEHKAAAEEAMSMNEELQSSNEELETSKEEMQSLNEELTTVNAQLHAKMEELQSTSSDLRSLLASTDIAVIFLDAKLRIRRYTPAARKLLELIGSDIGRPLSDLAKKFTDPDLANDAMSVLDRLVPIEREVQSDEGRWYARRVLPHRTVENRIDGVVITFVDISDAKRAHDLAAQATEAVRADLRAMQSLQAATNLVLRAKDIPSVLEEILLAALELCGTHQGSFRLQEGTTKLQMVAHRGLASELVEALTAVSLSDGADPAIRAAIDKKPVVVEDVSRQLPAALRDRYAAAGIQALQVIPLLTRENQTLGVMTLYFSKQLQLEERSLRIMELLARLGADSVERMRIERERESLLQNEQIARRALDDAVQIKDDFLASLSHELRTPLSAIMLWGKLLRAPAVDAETMKKAVDAILDSAESQARLIEDLLDSAATAAGKLRLEPREMDLIETLRATIEQNEPAARAKNLRIELEVQGDIGIIIADPTRLRQVVWNLLSNAVKFTPEGGRIGVSIKRDGEMVQLKISDSGVGIPVDFLPHVFDRFRQYQASITRKHAGLGLGLTICKQLVEMHGGTIRAESSGANEGTTFTIELPMPAVRPRARLRGASPAPAGTPLVGRTILLVEDDQATQHALSTILELAGASVKTAANGAEAVDLYRDFRPQIILSDIGLPDTSGYRLLDRIRAFEREHNLAEAPAIALTAFDRDEDRQKAAAAGFGIHLAKPIDSDELISLLTTLGPAS